MKAIIFGAGGQDGYYLTLLLKANRVEVASISRSRNFINGSVADYAFVEEQVKQRQPNYIFHLAANSTTKHAALFENHETISTGTFNVLEAARLHCRSAKIFLSGSAMQFKNSGLPIDEQTEFAASSPYAVARIQSVYAGRYYREKFGMQVYVGYFFNHDSPLRNAHHVNQKIIKGLQRILRGDNNPIIVGNINVRKEFGFAGDVARAIFKLVQQESVFEAVIGTGVAYSIKDWIELCFEIAGVNWEKHIVVENSFVPEYDILVSNPNLINSIGWKPETGFRELAKIMIENGE